MNLDPLPPLREREKLLRGRIAFMLNALEALTVQIEVDPADLTLAGYLVYLRPKLAKSLACLRLYHIEMVRLNPSSPD